MRARLFGLVFADFDWPFTGAGRWLVGLVVVLPSGEVTYRALDAADRIACPMDAVPTGALARLSRYLDPRWRPADPPTATTAPDDPAAGGEVS